MDNTSVNESVSDKTVKANNAYKCKCSTYFISGGEEVSAIYIDQDQASSLWCSRVNQHKKSLAGSRLLHPKNIYIYVNKMLPGCSR